MSGIADIAFGQRLAASWLGDVDLQRVTRQVGTPVFIYNELQLLRNVQRVKDAADAVGLGGRVELYVPFFPNANPHVLRTLQAVNGVGLLVQIPAEYELLSQHGFKRYIVSPGHVGDDEIRYWSRHDHPTFLSSLDEVAFMLGTNARTISVRIDSLGSEKPGVKYGQLSELAAMLAARNRTLECFEVYCGSGNSLSSMIAIVDQIFEIYRTHFPTARSINFAGGHGFLYEPWTETDKHFDWRSYFAAIADLARQHSIPEHVTLLFEPARDVLADAGALLLGVKRSIVRNPVANLVVTDGSRMLMPSAQYRARRHNVVFLDPTFREMTVAAPQDLVSCLVRGRTILRNDYVLPGTYPVPAGVEAGCHMLILDVGAYCATQHMEFLNVPPAPEVLIDCNGQPHLVTQRGSDMDKWRHLLPERLALAS